MDIRKKILSIVGVLALTMSMTGGIASAQTLIGETEATGSTDIFIKINCGTGNTIATGLTLNAGSTDAVAFDPFDPSDAATVATAPGAFRVDVVFGNCLTTNWSVNASITDFTDPDATPINTLSGRHFQIPVSEGTVWMAADDTPALHVTNPASSSTITFGNESSTSPHAANTALASANASGTASGSMSLVFGAEMAGLTSGAPDGDYTAKFTVTFNAGTP